MIPTTALLAGLLLSVPALAQDVTWPSDPVEAPSGQTVRLVEVLYEEQPYSGEMQVVLRVLAPDISGDGLANSQLREDMDWACRHWGIAAAGILSAAPDWIVVEMMAEPVERGLAQPDIRRVFETYRLAGPVCIWELF